MDRNEMTEAYALQGKWAAETMSRLIPALVEKGVITPISLAVAVSDLESAKQSCSPAGQELFTDVQQRLIATYGNGHFG